MFHKVKKIIKEFCKLNKWLTQIEKKLIAINNVTFYNR